MDNHTLTIINNDGTTQTHDFTSREKRASFVYELYQQTYIDVYGMHPLHPTTHNLGVMIEWNRDFGATHGYMACDDLNEPN